MHRDLGIEQDLAFQDLAWRIQRAGWVLLALILIGAMTGLFGHGLLARATAQDGAGSLRLDYQRFLRYEAPEPVTLLLSRSGEAPSGRVHIQLHDHYLRDVTIHEILPTPTRVTKTADGMEYEFLVSEGDTATLSFSLSAHAVGPVTGLIRNAQRDWVRFTHYVYP